MACNFWGAGCVFRDTLKAGDRRTPSDPMKTTIIEPLLYLPRTFLENGLRAGLPGDIRRRILRLNLFLLSAMAVALTQLVFSYVNQLFYSAMVHLVAVFLVTIGFFLIKDGRIRSSRAVGILAVNLHLFAISYLEGLRSGAYLLVFPLLFTLAFVIDLRRSKLEMALTATLTMTTMALIYILAPYENAWQRIPTDLYDGLYGTNLSVSMALTAIFAIIILKTLDNHELKLMDEKHLSETIYDTSLDSVLIVHAALGTVIGCNRRATELFGFGSKQEAVGRQASELLGREMAERIAAFNGQAPDSSAAWQGGLTLGRRDGTPFHAHVNLVPFLHRGQLYCKTSLLDMTEIRVAEREAQHAREKADRANRVKSRFLSTVSHELRTPLNGIIGTTGLLLEEECLEAQRPHLDVLQHASEHMLQLVNDILDFSKLEADKMVLEEAPFHLLSFLHKAAAPFLNTGRAGVRLQVEADPALDTEVHSDELRLNQVLNNLLSNARKFTLEGGITLRATTGPIDAEGRTPVRFCVSDTGIGIPPQSLRQIFESFTQAEAETTRRFGGTGLGLAISRHIVERMGGRLEVQSEPGKGSDFYFTLPLRLTRKRAQAPVENHAGTLSLPGLRILIAEDNPVNLMVAERILAKWGVETVAARNGRELLIAYRTGNYHLLLVDLDMPEMDGAEAVAEIRRTDTHIPVIAFTAAVYDNIQSDLLAKGFNDFLPKPFRPETLHRKICQLTAVADTSLPA